MFSVQKLIEVSNFTNENELKEFHNFLLSLLHHNILIMFLQLCAGLPNLCYNITLIKRKTQLQSSIDWSLNWFIFWNVPHQSVDISSVCFQLYHHQGHLPWYQLRFWCPHRNILLLCSSSIWIKSSTTRYKKWLFLYYHYWKWLTSIPCFSTDKFNWPKFNFLIDEPWKALWCKLPK